MKVVLLAGGLGTRLSEETGLRPKPMVEIGGKPILWHIMKMYSHYGFNEFIICCGYMAYSIKEYFANYFLHQSDISVDLVANSIEIHKSYAEPWKITMVDTGLDTMTGGRLKRVKEYIGNETCMLTYGDGVADIDIKALLAFHKQQGKKATISVVQPSGRFGSVSFDEKDQLKVLSFKEKPQGDGNWINGGFFVLEPEVFDTITGDKTIFEREPLEGLASEGELVAYRHHGFWRPMDTLRDKIELEGLWASQKAVWKTWK